KRVNCAFRGMRARAEILLMIAMAGCTPEPPLPATPPPPAVCSPTPADSAGRSRSAVCGAVRPAEPDDTANYPTAIVTGLFQQIAAQSPSFVVGTGDYMFASSSTAVDGQ